LLVILCGFTRFHGPGKKQSVLLFEQQLLFCVGEGVEATPNYRRSRCVRFSFLAFCFHSELDAGNEVCGSRQGAPTAGTRHTHHLERPVRAPRVLEGDDVSSMKPRNERCGDG